MITVFWGAITIGLVACAKFWPSPLWGWGWGLLNLAFVRLLFFVRERQWEDDAR